MKKHLYIFPVVFLILSILVMNSGKYLKNINDGDKIPELINDIESNVKTNNWIGALDNAKEIKIIFNKTSKLIQYSVERADIDEFNLHLALLDGYLIAHDQSNALAEIYILKEYWNELG